MSLLPFALLWAQYTPDSRGLTPYKIMFGRLPPLLPKLEEDCLAELDNDSLLKFLQALQMALHQTHTLLRAMWPDLSQ